MSGLEKGVIKNMSIYENILRKIPIYNHLFLYVGI
jgi:hypothetical protein